MKTEKKRKDTLILWCFYVILSLFLTNCTITSNEYLSHYRNVDFNSDWLFHEGSTEQAEGVGFDDSGWERVDLPHDWSMKDYKQQDSLRHGPFLKGQEMGDDVGYLRGGTGWYRKHLVLEKEDQGKLVFLHFDGVQSEMKCWVNGEFVGSHVYGYTPFYFEITPWLNEPGQPNVIAVEVDNPGKNTRWFNGSGIYRQVTLSKVHPLYIDIWGLNVNTLQVHDAQADISIDVKLKNTFSFSREVTVRTEVLSPSGHPLIERSREKQLLPGATDTLRFLATLDQVELWEPENPFLYTLRAVLLESGEEVDQLEIPFGVRTIGYSASEGFLLNGNPLLLKGACMHHDNGLLGAAAFRRAEERRVEIMKNNGYNAIRTSHNPPSAAFLDACDRLGMLVIDESFDMWVEPKRPNDYHQYFEQWWKKDLETMLLRDRNHPSVIMWSFGNEVKERADESGIVIASKMIDFIRSFDATRPVTQAICSFWDQPGKAWDETAPAFELLDIGGYNYQWQNYRKDHQKFPDRIMYGSESVPEEAYENWKLVEELPYVIGDFVWTGLDYIGESGIGHSIFTEESGSGGTFLMPWPWYISWCGDIDITGQKKPQSYFRDVVWRESQMEILVHEPIPAGKTERVSFWGWPRERRSWNWEVDEGQPMQVNVYTRYPAVRLELNGRPVGEVQRSADSGVTATFTVPYQKGELRAIGIRDGHEIESKSLQTTGPVARLNVIPERTTIEADRGEIAYIQLLVTDDQDRLVPMAEMPVIVEVSGDGELLAAGSAAPTIEGSLSNPVVPLFRGRALIIVRSNGKPGAIHIKCEWDGIKAETTIQTI